MKKVLFIHHASTIGGGSYCLLNLLKEIKKDNFKPLVLLKDKGPLKEEIEKLGIEVIFFPNMHTVPYNKSLLKPSSLTRYIKVFQSLSPFKQILKDNAIDIIYLNNMMLYPYLKVSKELGIKSIIHVREHWPLDEHRFQLKYARKVVKECADEIVAINQYSSKIFPYPKATIVYDWIDMTSRYAPFNMQDIFGPKYKDYHIYLFTGGDSAIKGALPVIKGFSKYLKSENDRLLILGDKYTNPQINSLKTKIKFLLHKLRIRSFYEVELYHAVSIDNRIKFIPPTYYISSILEQSYCNLSFFTIPHANLAMAESMIMGLPTIAAKTEEAIEYSLNGKLASLFEINNTSEFKERLQELPLIRENLVKNIKENKNIISAMFDKKRNVEKIDTLINRLL